MTVPLGVLARGLGRSPRRSGPASSATGQVVQFWNGSLRRSLAPYAHDDEGRAGAPSDVVSAAAEQRPSSTTRPARRRIVPLWVKWLALRGDDRALCGLLVLHREPGHAAANWPRGSAAPLRKFLLNKWYFDELYDVRLRARPPRRSAGFFWKGGDGKKSSTARPQRRRRAGIMPFFTRRAGQAADRLSLSLCLRDAHRASRRSSPG